MPVRHLGVEIERPAAAVYATIRDYTRLPEWAAGLASGIAERDGRWVADSPMGEVTVRFCADNDFGVCDHDVTLPGGTVTTNPLRVVPDGPRCQLVFTVRDQDPVALEDDAALVAADLRRLKDLLER